MKAALILTLLVSLACAMIAGAILGGIGGFLLATSAWSLVALLAARLAPPSWDRRW